MTDKTVANTTPLVPVPCPCCGSTEGEVIYKTTQFAGKVLGRFETALVLCDTCTLLRQSPRPARDAIESYYAEDTNASGRVFSLKDQGTFDGDMNSHRTDFILSLPIPKTARLLDVGCGSGWFLNMMKKNGMTNIAGLEPIPAACEITRSFGIPVINARMDEVIDKHEIGLFDVVTTFTVLEHVYDPSEFLTQAIALVREGGYLILDVPDSNQPFVTLAEYYAFEHLTHFTYATLENLLSRLGMEIVTRSEQAFENGELLIMAVKKANSKNTIDLMGAKEQLLTTIARYSKEKRILEQQVIDTLGNSGLYWRSHQSRVAIYGAGVHTLFLLGLCDISSAVTCILDSDPSKWGMDYNGWTVYGPDDIERLNLDVIIISSKDYEWEIYNSIRNCEEKGVQIIRFYTNNAEKGKGLLK